MSTRPAPRRHTATQKLILAVNCVLVLACFAGAVALLVGERIVGSQQKVELVGNLAEAADPAAPDDTFPIADPEAKNFLITGADNNQCVDPNSPFAGAFGDRSSFGERSDTIMVMRVDPATSQAAVLSFPRDLWVKIAGTNSENRINSAYKTNDPSTLITTLYDNFGIGIDHFVQVDFCAFKTLVDAVGGVPVPFEYLTRDTHTGLYVPQPGCFTFNGDHALAYVRSRHYEYWDPAVSKWKEDPASDLGRISRQQDFLRRVIAKALKTGVYTPSVARGLIDTARKYVVTDTNLTPKRMLEFAGVIQDLDPAKLQSYQIEASAGVRSGNSVLIPHVGGDNMKAVLDIFRGKAPLSTASNAEVTTTAGSAAAAPTTAQPSSGQPSNAQSTSTTSTTSASAASTSTPTEENVKGIVPPKDVEC